MTAVLRALLLLRFSASPRETTAQVRCETCLSAGATSAPPVAFRHQSTGAIIDAAISLHRELGPGLFESVYESILAAELARRGLRVQRQHPIGFSYDGLEFDNAFHVDLLVDECVVVELKAVDKLAPVHTRQLLTYLRLSGLDVGLLLNFGAGTMKEGLKRVVNDIAPSASPLLRVNRSSI